MESAKEGAVYFALGNRLISILKEKLAGAVPVYDPRGLADLGSPEAKPADMERNIEGTVLQVQKKEGSCRLDYQHVCGLSDWLVHWSWP
jgi:hypothetical protein